jgi:hypothetical protein
MLRSNNAHRWGNGDRSTYVWSSKLDRPKAADEEHANEGGRN